MSRLAIFPLLVLLAGLLPLAAMVPATLLPLQQGISRAPGNNCCTGPRWAIA
ncbi:hypothetical protein NMD64_08335 [Edwardsiella tarda]|uniref:hypothetical protein n=1 Tax=Edwardsiella tarda TaxID=636 RepID=UPI00351CB452